MQTIFKAKDDKVQRQKLQRKFLAKENDRLLEKVLCYDVVSVIMNSLYESGNALLVNDHAVDSKMLRKEINNLEH